jgi:hypothetical protein
MLLAMDSNREKLVPAINMLNDERPGRYDGPIGECQAQQTPLFIIGVDIDGGSRAIVMLIPKKYLVKHGSH